MKRILSVILTAALLAALCVGLGGCSKTPAGPQSPGKPSGNGDPEPVYVDDQTVDSETSDEPADGLNVYGLPDLSGYSAEEIWDMYVHPENWDRAVLDLCDGDLFPADDQVRVEEEIPDYVFDLGDWEDYDPGDWEPGPDEKMDYGDAIEGPEGSEGGEDGESGLLTSIPAEYAFLLPEGLRTGDVAAENEGSLMLSLPNRTGEDFAAIVERVKNAGYTKDAQEMNMMGIQMYEARNGSKSVSVMLQNGTVIVSIE
jgi:hypothetical protein